MAALLRETAQCRGHAPISESTAKRYLETMNFAYKRYLCGLKKAKSGGIERAREVINALAKLEQRCKLLNFDESGFSPNPPVQYGRGRISQTGPLNRSRTDSA